MRPGIDRYEFKRLIGVRLLQQFGMSEIRSRSIENLNRWRAHGTWPPVNEEWLKILTNSDDAVLRTIMTASDEESERLRQSLPYVGLLSREEVAELRKTVIVR